MNETFFGFPVACRAIIFNANYDRVLLIRHNNGEYGIVGGHIERDEELETAVRREVFEEIGADTLLDLKRYDFMRLPNNKISLFYTCHLAPNTVFKVDGVEAAEIIWASLEDIMSVKYDLKHYQALVSSALLSVGND